MKKSKIIPIKTDQLIDHKTIKKISEGLESLDIFQFETPNQHWFENFVLEKQKQAKAKWRKELFLFACIAIFILSGIVISLYQMPIIFILLQTIGISFILVYSVIQILKQVNSSEG